MTNYSRDTVPLFADTRVYVSYVQGWAAFGSINKWYSRRSALLTSSPEDPADDAEDGEADEVHPLRCKTRMTLAPQTAPPQDGRRLTGSAIDARAQSSWLLVAI